MSYRIKGNLTILLFMFFVFVMIGKSWASCDLYIHGHLAKTDYFDKYERHIEWDSSLELEKAAEVLAPKILEEASDCEEPVFLRTHGYSSNVVFYILGLGNRYSKIYLGHDYVKVYKKVTAVYSYGGAFQGTPLMDVACADGADEKLTNVIGKKCVVSMTTSKIHHPTSVISSPGVPIYIVYSTNKSNYSEISGNILNYYNIDWETIEKGYHNQNDGIFLQSSALGCKESLLFIDPAENCKKISPVFFKDFLHVDEFGHTEMAKNPELMRANYE